jgi:hypothetical protein
MMTPLDPATPIPITLQVQQWNIVLEILSNQPWRTVAPLIEAITSQANAAAGASNVVPLHQPNGADHVQD